MCLENPSNHWYPEIINRAEFQSERRLGTGDPTSNQRGEFPARAGIGNLLNAEPVS